jgi:hypothetical protein
MVLSVLCPLLNTRDMSAADPVSPTCQSTVALYRVSANLRLTSSVCSLLQRNTTLASTVNTVFTTSACVQKAHRLQHNGLKEGSVQGHIHMTHATCFT